MDTDHSVIARIRDGPAFAALERLLPEILQSLLEDQTKASILPLPHGFLDTSIADALDNTATETSYPQQKQDPQMLASAKYEQEGDAVGAASRGQKASTHGLTVRIFEQGEKIGENIRRSSVNGVRDRMDSAAVAPVVNEPNLPTQQEVPVKKEPEDTIGDAGGLSSINPAQITSQQDAEVSESQEAEG